MSCISVGGSWWTGNKHYTLRKPTNCEGILPKYKTWPWQSQNNPKTYGGTWLFQPHTCKCQRWWRSSGGKRREDSVWAAEGFTQIFVVFLFFYFRPQVFPSVPAREPSSISSWSESQASRKFNFAELWPTLLLSHCVPISATCWARWPPWLLFPPYSKTKFINETIFPIMFVNEVRGYVWGGPRPTCPAPWTANDSLFLSILDGHYWWWLCIPDEDAAPNCHACVKLPLAYCGDGHHPAAGACRPVLPKPPEEGRSYLRMCINPQLAWFEACATDISS